MKLQQAIQILKDHNEWRRFDGISDAPIELYPSMAHPRELGIAIDTVVNKFENICIYRSTEKKCKEQCDMCKSGEWYVYDLK